MAGVVTHLFSVGQLLCRGEAQLLGIEPWDAMVIVELETSSIASKLKHFFLPVVNGNLQVVDRWLHRWTGGWWEIYC